MPLADSVFIGLNMSGTTEDSYQEELECLLFELDWARENHRVPLDYIVSAKD